MKQDKNFTVRLKAAIERRINYTGLADKLMSGTLHYEDYENVMDTFINSIDNLTLNYLQGKGDDPEWEREAVILEKETKFDLDECRLAVRYAGTFEGQANWLIKRHTA